MDLRNVTRAQLDTMVGKTITDFCSVLTAADLNHCAHFVSHALDITTGMRCGNGDVWHYSNNGDLVVQESVDAFETRFRGTYGTGIALFYGYRQDI